MAYSCPFNGKMLILVFENIKQNICKHKKKKKKFLLIVHKQVIKIKESLSAMKSKPLQTTAMTWNIRERKCLESLRPQILMKN